MRAQSSRSIVRFQVLLESIKDKKYIEYFRNLMYRLVLNGESHSEERVRSLMDDNDFFEML